MSGEWRACVQTGRMWRDDTLLVDFGDGGEDVLGLVDPAIIGRCVCCMQRGDGDSLRRMRASVFGDPSGTARRNKLLKVARTLCIRVEELQPTSLSPRLA